jgi:hypothetical protein
MLILTIVIGLTLGPGVHGPVTVADGEHIAGTLGAGGELLTEITTSHAVDPSWWEVHDAAPGLYRFDWTARFAAKPVVMTADDRAVFRIDDARMTEPPTTPYLTRPFGWAIDTDTLETCDESVQLSACVDYWDVLRGVWGATDRHVYARFRDATPTAYAVRVAPRDVPAVFFSWVDGATLENVEITASDTGILLYQSRGNLVRNVRVRHARRRVWIRMGAAYNRITGADVTLDAFGRAEFGSHAVSRTQDISYTIDARRYFGYRFSKRISNSASSDDVGVRINEQAGPGNRVTCSHIHDGIIGVDLGDAAGSGIMEVSDTRIARHSSAGIVSGWGSRQRITRNHLVDNHLQLRIHAIGYHTAEYDDHRRRVEFVANTSALEPARGIHVFLHEWWGTGACTGVPTLRGSGNVFAEGQYSITGLSCGDTITAEEWQQ